MKPKRIRLIITGGTFDKSYDAIRGELTFSQTHLPRILEEVRCSVPIELEINQLVDSLEMGDDARQRIVAACRKSPEERIVVVHGTDTMTLTADRLAAEFGAESSSARTIVLTGAMVPYTIAGSDAVFNLGSAVAAVQLLDSGVYVVMHGQIFAAGTVVKDRGAGLFRHQAT